MPTPPSLPWPVTAEKFFVRLVKAMTYAYGFLCSWGWWVWRRVFFRRDQQPMLLFGVLLWSAIALRMHEGLGIDIRYYLPGVIVSAGYAGLGLLWIAKWNCRLTAGRMDWTGPRRAALCCAWWPLCLRRGSAIGPWRSGGSWCSTPIWENGSSNASARTSGSSARAVRNAIGRLLLPRRHRAEPRTLLLRGEGLVYTIRDCKPDVLILWCDEKHQKAWPSEWRKLLDGRPELGLCRVPADQLPRSCQTPQAAESLIVAVRKELLHAATRWARPPGRRPATRRSCGPG